MIKIEIIDDVAIIHRPFPWRFMQAVQQLSGRKVWGDGHVSIQATPANMRMLQESEVAFEIIDNAHKLDDQRAFEALPTQHAKAELVTDYQPALPLYQHQKHALALSWDREAYALLLEMGLGKSAILIANAGMLFKAGKIKGCLIIAPKGVHRQWLEQELPKHLDASIEHQCWLWKGKTIKFKFDEGLQFLAMNTDALRTHQGQQTAMTFLELLNRKVMMITDECFTAETNILTPTGAREIKDICVGDLVITPAGPRKVSYKFSGKSSILIKIILSSGVEILATPNHPFFTNNGWKRASELSGEELLNEEGVSELLNCFCNRERAEEILRTILRSEMALEDQQSCNVAPDRWTRGEFEKIKIPEREEKAKNCCCKNRKTSFRGPQKFNQDNQEEKRSWIYGNWWKWQRNAKGATSASGCNFERLDSRISSEAWRKISWLSNLLQGGFRLAREKIGNRGGWWKSQHSCKKSTGQKERRKAGRVRVARVEIQKRDDLCDVYNLEVEGCPHYFAAGFLVHNSHMFKDYGTKRTRALLNFRPLVPYRRIATGTPIAKNIMDAWTQFMFLDQRILGHKYMSSFRSRYCIMGGWEGRQIVGQRNVEEFYSLIAPHSYRLTKSEALDLPEKIYVTREYEMSEETAKVYKEMRDTLMVQFADGAIADAPNAAVALLRLQQIVCGSLPTEEGRQETGKERINELLEIVRQVEGPVVVWARFIDNIKAIEAALATEGEVVTYYGATTTTEREEAVKRFCSGQARFFVSNPAAGGVGLNLQLSGCLTAVYFSNSFDLVHRLQSEDRLHRIGTKGAVSYFDICARKSVDRRILGALRTKRDIASMTLDEIRQAIRED